MTESSEFSSTIVKAADRISKAIPPNGEVTAWELKTRLGLSSSILYLALGNLFAEGKIELNPQQLNLMVSAKKT
jgi:ribosomal protein S25